MQAVTTKLANVYRIYERSQLAKRNPGGTHLTFSGGNIGTPVTNRMNTNIIIKMINSRTTLMPFFLRCKSFDKQKRCKKRIFMKPVSYKLLA